MFEILRFNFFADKYNFSKFITILAPKSIHLGSKITGSSLNLVVKPARLLAPWKSKNLECLISISREFKKNQRNILFLGNSQTGAINNFKKNAKPIKKVNLHICL